MTAIPPATPIDPTVIAATGNAIASASGTVAPDQVGDQEWAVVQSIDPTTEPTLTVKINNSPTPTSMVKYVASYSPTVGDTVIVEWVGLSTSDPVVTGVLATAALPAGTAAAQLLAPVGHVIITSLSANPATYLGFGTWAAISQGQFLVGAGTSDKTFTGGTAGGSSTIQPQNLPVLPPWPTSDPNVGIDLYINTSSGGVTFTSGGIFQIGTQVYGTVGMGNNAGGGQQYSPPFYVVYVWLRTA